MSGAIDKWREHRRAWIDLTSLRPRYLVGCVALVALGACGSGAQPRQADVAAPRGWAPSVAIPDAGGEPAMGEPGRDAGADGAAMALGAAEEHCVSTGKVSACFSSLPAVRTAVVDEAFKNAATCVEQCIKRREAEHHAALAAETEACVTRYVDAAGRGRVSCHFALATPGVDRQKLGGELEHAMRAAVATRDAAAFAALDGLMLKSVGEYFANVEPDCSRKCAHAGAARLAAAKTGPQLVLKYKQCMVDADATVEARRAAHYDVELYCALVRKANERCRSAARCDWLEEHSRLTCTYANQAATCLTE